jgi:predicted RecA/RadA family phage recombinase
MSYTGQPVPSTVHHSYRAKVSDGRSVRVTVPANSEIVSQQFYLIGGFFGAAMQSVKTGAGETAEVILDIEQAEYETDQITTTEAFDVGTSIYWDADTGKLTETATDNRLVGRVTAAKDANNVIWFLLGPQV